jgi:hypothetical protein
MAAQQANRGRHASKTTLTDEDRADLARFLREAIEADRYPLSPRVRRLKELLAKVDPTPAPAVMPHPVPKPAGEPSHMLAKKRRRLVECGSIVGAVKI